MKHQDYKKNMIQIINELGYRHDTWKVFSDFIEISAIALSNAVDKRNYSQREKRYMEVVSSYSSAEAAKLTKILQELLYGLEENMNILGEIFQELNLNSKWLGQFFTPIQISGVMGGYYFN